MCVCCLLSTSSLVPCAMQILKFHLLEMDLSVHGGELGRPGAAAADTGDTHHSPLLSATQMLKTSHGARLFLKSTLKRSNSCMPSSILLIELNNYFHMLALACVAYIISARAQVQHITPCNAAVPFETQAMCRPWSGCGLS